MNDQTVIELGRNALTITILLSAPLLGIALAVGLVVSIFQAVTQINESTLTFIPKIIAVFATLALFGPWMLSVVLAYTSELFGTLPYFVR